MDYSRHSSLDVGKIYRLLEPRRGFVGTWPEWATSDIGSHSPVDLVQESLFFLVGGPYTSGRGPSDDAILAEILCDGLRCIVLLTPNVYELAD